MKKSKCTHIRIRDDNDYNLDIEALINSIQKEFQIDFRSLPQWQDLVRRLHASKTDYKRRIQYANLQKATIIDKLYIQSTRPSPFELTADLARTADKWKRMENELKMAKIAARYKLEELSEEAIEEITGDELNTQHPNTENVSTDDRNLSLTEPSKMDTGVQYSTTHTPLHVTDTSLPVFICTNSHKLISPLDSQTSQLSCHTVPDKELVEEVTKTEIEEWLPSTTTVVCNPTPINVIHSTLEEQSLTFSLTNCTGEHMHVRFKYVTDCSPFVKAKILPKIPKRLYPGLPVVYKFIFKLRSENAFNSGLYFRVGRDVYANTPSESLFVPIINTFGVDHIVRVTDTVTIPSVYPWHIKIEPDSVYPTGIVRISVNDPYSYHLHIHKRNIDLSTGSDIFMSIRASPPPTESFVEREAFIHSETDFPVKSKASLKSNLSKISKSKSSSKNKTLTGVKSVATEVTQINVGEDIIHPIVEDIVHLALEPFVFDCTYMYLHPYSKRTINVYFTKAEHIGCHQSYYDFQLIDPETEKVIINKTIKVFAEVLANPIQIKPVILDMSNSLFAHGYYEDQFIVTNTHRVFPVTAYIKLTTKMKKLFYVIPMKSLVPAQSSVTFEVKFCSRDYLSPTPLDDLVHFTFKIVVVGYKTVYHHVPPIFYEIIVPCAAEFKQVYSEKYFKDTE